MLAISYHKYTGSHTSKRPGTNVINEHIICVVISLEYGRVRVVPSSFEAVVSGDIDYMV